MTTTSENAAENLEGLTLPGGWRVRDRVSRQPGDTGGNFSVSYIVERDGQKAFCKVLNYGWIFSAGAGVDPARKLQEATELYNFERDIARQCVRMSKVVTAIDDGQMSVTGFRYDAVSFIVFEMADRDVRRMLNETGFVESEVKLRLLRDLATGVRQLHGQRISHQDIKPSNLLVFADDDESRVGKVGDLGRVVPANGRGPFNNLRFAGDYNYAPPEVLYGVGSSGFGPDRLATDLYQIGGMIAFCFAAQPINGLLVDELYPTFHWAHWTGSYEEVLPYVQDAMGRAINRVIAIAPSALEEDLRDLLTQLCEPDPARRGDAKRIGKPDQYALQRFVSKLDLLSSRAALAERK